MLENQPGSHQEIQGDKTLQHLRMYYSELSHKVYKIHKIYNYHFKINDYDKNMQNIYFIFFVDHSK